MTFPIVPTDIRVTRQILGDDPDLMIVAFRFDAGAEGKRHEHRHVQSTYVESGRFTFDLDGVEHDLGPGDSLIVPSGLRHGCICQADGTLIDNFKPRRDDFL